MARNENRELFLNALSETGKATITKQELTELCNRIGILVPQWFTKESSNRVARGVYKVMNSISKPTVDPIAVDMVAKVLPMTKRIENVVTELESENLIPKAYRNYVPFGNFDDLLQVIASKMFYPVFITGQSGNGKTMSVEQACAKLGRKFVCISMTPETDESDLLGNFVLIDGQMVWRDGPVTVAARQGAVLCIDEVDYGAQNLAALQRVLEGKPFLLKKKNEVVTPTEGFTIIATANTKGKGSEDGRYMFTNILNEAFLERFPMTMEQDWAPNAVEKKILRKELNSVNRTDDTFADNLVTWAEAIRRTFADGGCDEVISTRRLVHIAKAYGIYGDRIKAITFCLNRFDTDTKISFIDLYTKIDAGVNVSDAKPAEEVQPKPNPNEEVAF
jgi:MoxR-like ATPase